MGDSDNEMDLLGACVDNLDVDKSEDVRNKRKGSPLSKDEPTKKQVSDSITSSQKMTLRRQNSMPNIAKASSVDKRKSGNLSFSDMIKMTFNDTTFAKNIAPVIHELISPLIQETIQATVSSTVTAAINGMKESVIDQMIDSNAKLQETVSIQTKVIEDQKVIIKDQSKQLDSKSETICELECEVKYLMSEVDKLKWGLDDLEQYGRRNSLRINNLQLERPFDKFGNEREFTRSVLNFLNRVILKGQGVLQESDIERCHTIGRPKKSRPKQVIVKFARYHDKRRVFLAKSSLKGNSYKTFITEDLTSANHSIIKSLLPLKKSEKIDSFWSRDGKIFVKMTKEGDVIRIKPNEDVEKKLNVELPEVAEETEGAMGVESPMDGTESTQSN